MTQINIKKIKQYFSELINNVIFRQNIIPRLSYIVLSAICVVFVRFLFNSEILTLLSLISFVLLSLYCKKFASKTIIIILGISIIIMLGTSIVLLVIELNKKTVFISVTNIPKNIGYGKNLFAKACCGAVYFMEQKRIFTYSVLSSSYPTVTIYDNVRHISEEINYHKIADSINNYSALQDSHIEYRIFIKPIDSIIYYIKKNRYLTKMVKYQYYDVNCDFTKNDMGKWIIRIRINNSLEYKDIEWNKLDRFLQCASYILENVSPSQVMKDLYLTNKSDKLYALCQTAIKKDIEVCNAYTMLGYYYKKLGNFQEVIKNLNLAKKYDKNNIRPLMTLAAHYFERGKYQNALHELSNMLKINNKHKNALIFQVSIYCRMGNYKNAENTINKLLDYYPKDVKIYTIIGAIYSECRKYEKAIVYLQKAISIKRNYAAAYCYLGIVYKYLHDDERAITYLIKALENNQK